MLRNYLILWYRRMMRRKAFAAINVAGLSISLAGALLIYSYVSHELSFDRFHEKADRIFRIYCAYAKPGESVRKFPYTPLVLSPAAIQEIPDLEASVRVWEVGGSVMVQHEEKIFKESAVFRADSGFFSVFSGQFLAGNPARCLTLPQSLVLSRTTAEKYFGSAAQALNKSLKVKAYFEATFTVTAVVEDFPANSHFLFNALLSVDYGKENFHPDNWLSHDPFTYVLLPEKANRRAVEDRIKEMTERILDPIYRDRFGNTYQEQKQAGGLQEYRLQPLKEVHLYSADMDGGGGGIRYVYILSTIGVMLILLACFNYVNLSTARSAWDAKSAGIRKVLGSTRPQLYSLFLTESVGVALLASIVAIALAQIMLASDIALLNSLIPYNVSAEACLMLLALGFLVGFFSGLVPAKLVSAFQPTQVIKGQLAKGKGGNSLRQILVVSQFVISMGLIMCTLLISSQLTFIQNMSLGFEKEQLMVVNNIDKIGDRKTTFKEMVRNESFVADATLCYGILGMPGNSAAFTPVELIEQGREDIVIGIPVYIGDEDYLKTLGVKLLMGRTFPHGLPRENQQIILNEEALRSIGWRDRKAEELIGKVIDVNGLKYELAGIVEDYHFRSLHQKITPMAILSHYYQGYEQLMVRIRPGTMRQAMQQIREDWRRVAPELSLEYSFVEDDLQKLYASEQNLGLLFRGFAGLAIFIACLGLLGLVMFSAERKLKEIGIRKVLGATAGDIVVNLSRDMVMLITVAFLLATPLSWYLMENWLENFAYRIEINALTFLLAGGLTLFIAMFTISYQSIRAALINPVESLRYE